MLHHVDPAERYDLCRVSRSWYTFLTTEPALWPTLHHVHLHKHQSQLLLLWISRASYHAKQRGGITSVAVDLRNYRESPDASASGRMRELCTMLEQSCVPVLQDSAGRRWRGRATLRHFQLYLEPDTLAAFAVLGVLVRRAREPAFNSLLSLTLSTRLPYFIIHTHFFAIWPHLETLRLINTSPTPAPHHISPLHDWNDISTKTISTTACSNLRHIDLSGVNINEQFHVHPMPVLTSLALSGVTWSGRSFFYLLRMVRRSLVVLDCADLVLEELEGREMADWTRYVMVTDPALVDGHIFPDYDSQASEEFVDEPAPILFPRLQRLCLSGEDTPPFFASLEYVESTQSSSLPTPIFVMPSLLHAAFTEMPADLESLPEDAEGALATFGRNAPNLLTLSLYNSSFSDLALFHCLAGLMGKLQVLNLCSTTITDKLIARLPSLVPRLIELDVTGCDDVSLQGVARCVEVMQDPEDEKRKLKVVKVDIPRYIDADYDAYLWLDWIGVLHRDEWDHTGLGPSAEIDGGKAKRRWIVAGKLDAEKEDRRLREERAEMLRRQEAEVQARMIAAYGFQQGGASSTGTGGSSTFGGGSNGESNGGSSMGRVLSSATTNGNSPATDANSVFPVDPNLYAVAAKEGMVVRGNQDYPSDIVTPQLPPHPLATFYPQGVVPSSNGHHAAGGGNVEEGGRVVEEYSSEEEEMEQVS